MLGFLFHPLGQEAKKRKSIKSLPDADATHKQPSAVWRKHDEGILELVPDVSAIL
jgi:hypothetical protein